MNPIITMAAHVRRREAYPSFPEVTSGTVLAEPLVRLWDEMRVLDLPEIAGRVEEDSQWLR